MYTTPPVPQCVQAVLPVPCLSIKELSRRSQNGKRGSCRPALLMLRRELRKVLPGEGKAHSAKASPRFKALPFILTNRLGICAPGERLTATSLCSEQSKAVVEMPEREAGLGYKRPSETSRKYIAAARVRAAAFGSTDTCKNITWQEGAVCRSSKERLLGQKGCVIWLTGLSGSGKSTVAIVLEHALAAHGRLTTLLDGDNIRHGLNNNLGFSPRDREENIRRIGEVAKLMMESGVMTIASFISPYQKDRDLVRSRMPAGDFIEVYLNVPLEVCEERDPKGLYKLARAGKIKCFTGVDDPYEEPPNAEIVLEHVRPGGTPNTPDDMAATIVDYLMEQGFLGSDQALPNPSASNGG